MFEISGIMVAAGLVGLVIGLGILTLVFQAGCALADVIEPGYFKSFLLVLLVFAVWVPLAGAILYVLVLRDAGLAALFGPMGILGIVLSLLVGWALGGLLYPLFLAASYARGLLVRTFELLLGALLSALVAAVILVVLAAVQIARKPEAPKTPTPSAVLPAAPASTWLS